MENRDSRAFSDDPMVNTDFPVKRYTAVQYTQPAAAISPLSKSTRHLLVPEPDPRYYYTHRAHQETIAIDKDNLKQGKKISLPNRFTEQSLPRANNRYHRKQRTSQ